MPLSHWSIQLFDLRASSSNDVPIGLLGSLSNDVFERRTSTGSEPFSLFICLDANKLVLLSFFSLLKTIYLRVSTKPFPVMQKVHFRLTSVAQKRCCLSSLLTTAIKRIDQGCLSSVLFSQFTRPYRRLDEMAIRLLRWPHLRLRQRLDLCCIELRYKAVLGSESLSHFPAQLCNGKTVP